MTGLHSRRQFLQGSLTLAGLGLLSGCGMLPPQEPQPSKVLRIGYLALGTPPDPRWENAREVLRERGWVEGENLLIEYRITQDRQQFGSLAAELVGLPVDLIFASGTPTAQAARQATQGIPIVAPGLPDPVGDGLVASLARPGGNVTGTTSAAAGMAGKRLELLKEALPTTSRVAALWNPASPPRIPEFRETEEAAGRLGLRLQSLEVRGPDDFAAAFEGAARERVQALIMLNDSMTLSYRAQLVDLVARHRLPAMSGDRDFVEAGGLMVYGPSHADLWRLAATYVDRILRGAQPAELPVEGPTRFEFAINLKTAHALGLTIPQVVLQQATEIIQ